MHKRISIKYIDLFLFDDDIKNTGYSDKNSIIKALSKLNNF